MKKIWEWLKEILSPLGGQTAANILKTVGESQLDSVLQDLHDSNIDDYQATIQAGDALVKHLKPGVLKSASKIDDAFIGALEDVIALSAAKNGIAL